MDVYELLAILTCSTSMVTMIIVVVAVLPHVKQGMVVIRDAILWVAFVLVVVAAGWIGWHRISQRFSAPSASSVDHAVLTRTRTVIVQPAPSEAFGDPYYRGSLSD